MTSNIKIVKSGIGTVTISTLRVDEISSNSVVAITQPKSSSNYADGPNVTKTVDLLKVERFKENSIL